jgi:hypothetical protein
VGDPLDLAHLLVVAACLPILLVAPGYAILTARGGTPADAIVYGPALTIAIIATGVVVAIPLGVSGAVASWVIVLGLIVVTIVLLARKRVTRPGVAATRPFLLMLLAFALLVGFDLVPSNPRFDATIYGYPSAPTGYPEHIANPRVPSRGGDHILQFRAEQAVWHRFVPAKGQFHQNWRFGDRPPLVGLVAAGLAGPPGAAPPVTYPGSPLGPRSDAAVRNREPVAAPATASVPAPIDAWGFWFYRLVVMLLSLLVLIPVFRLASDWFDERAATLAVVGAALAPALMLSAYYTSPKNLAAYFGMLSVLLVRRGSPRAAGLAVGGAYLCHPLGVFLGGAALVYQAFKSRAAAAWMAVTALPAVIAWGIYGEATGVRSSLLNTPLGCFDVDVTTSACWAQYRAKGVSVIAWDHVSAFFSSIVPEDLASPLRGGGYEFARFKWFEIHDFTFPGLVGLLFSALVVVGLVRAFPRYRLEIATLLGVQLLLILLAWGFNFSFAHIAGIGVLPLLYVFGGYGLSTLPPRLARFSLAGVAIEGILYFVSLIAPVPDVTTAAYVLMAAICIAAVGALVALGFSALRSRVVTTA